MLGKIHSSLVIGIFLLLIIHSAENKALTLNKHNQESATLTLSNFKDRRDKALAEYKEQKAQMKQKEIDELKNLKPRNTKEWTSLRGKLAWRRLQKYYDSIPHKGAILNVGLIAAVALREVIPWAQTKVYGKSKQRRNTTTTRASSGAWSHYSSIAVIVTIVTFLLVFASWAVWNYYGKQSSDEDDGEPERTMKGKKRKNMINADHKVAASILEEELAQPRRTQLVARSPRGKQFLAAQQAYRSAAFSEAKQASQVVGARLSASPITASTTTTTTLSNTSPMSRAGKRGR